MSQRKKKIKKDTNTSDNAKKKIHLKAIKCSCQIYKREIESCYKKLVKKEPTKTAKVVYNEETLKRKSIDELKEIAKLRRIKNWVN